MFKYLIILLFISCNGCSQSVVTPKDFIYIGAVADSLYKKDSAIILADLNDKMQKNESSFYSNEYFDSTRLIIDKILYDSTKNKIAVFVIVENPISRQKAPDLKYKVYYHAFCYLGKRTTLNTFELKWFRPLPLINFYNKEVISDRIEQRHFTELAAIIDNDDELLYKYNLNDIRFWDGPGWKMYFE